jgi:hypothetical protein
LAGDYLVLSIASGTQAANESNLNHIAIGDVIDAVDGVALRGLSQGAGHRHLHGATTIAHVQQIFCLFVSAFRADFALFRTERVMSLLAGPDGSPVHLRFRRAQRERGNSSNAPAHACVHLNISHGLDRDYSWQVSASLDGSHLHTTPQSRLLSPLGEPANSAGEGASRQENASGRRVLPPNWEVSEVHRL